ncbi:MAG: hypothetical protein KAI27_04235 [Rhodospirillaceae bacterium]|nr:hypothetical protein [Rhodospirillaceae bacterium]
MNINKVSLHGTIALLALATLNACQTISMPSDFNGVPIAAGTMAPAGLPANRVGDKYYYSNGSFNKIEKISPGRIEWINNRKRKSITISDPMAPQLYLETSTREYTKQTDASVGDLWPLTVGKSSSFTTNVKFKSKDSGKEGKFKQLWRCSVDGAERVRVLAGTFDTYRVSCTRRSRSTSNGKLFYRQTVIYHYAPEIGHHVRYESRTKGKTPYTRELIGVRPDIKFLSDKTAKNIRHTFQDALENYQNDKSASWSDKKTGVKTTTTPVQTFQKSDGKFCRNYKQIVNQGDGDRLYVGVACREGKLKWLTPRR